MVKYSDSPEFTHEQMELSTAYDLRNARIVQAQINNIDPVENCAGITLSNECAELSGKSVTAIKFFYHCEKSTGTVEDLAQGYKAFKKYDFVLVLWIPATDEVIEQFYIIGHVDIRGTAPCMEEFLLIGLEGNATGSYDNPRIIWVTIFDVSIGAVLNIETFENKDEFSPAKPTELPCIYSTYQTWLEYNFEIAIPGCVVGYELGEGYGTNPGTVTNIGYETTRTGDAICDVREGIESTTGTKELVLTHHEGKNYNSGTNRYLAFEEQQVLNNVLAKGDIFWELTDTTTSVVIPLFLEYATSMTNEGDWNASTGITNHSVSSEVTVSFSTNFSAPILVLTDEYSIISGSSTSSPIVGDFRSCMTFSPIDPVACTGEYGFYVLALCDDSAMRSNRLRAKFAGGDWNPVECDWYNIVMDWPYHTDTGTEYLPIEDLYGFSYANISLFSNLVGVDFSIPISLQTCMSATDISKAEGLDAAVRPLRRKIFELYHIFWSRQKPNIFTALRRTENA